MTIQLYPFQQEALEIMLNTEVGKPSLIALPTGTGKGFLLAALSTQVQGRTLICTPSTEIRVQAYEKIKLFDENADVGFVQARLDDIHSKIVIATRQSLTHGKSTRLERMLQNGEFEYVIFDEVHEAIEQTIKIIEKLNNNVKIIGLSATPFNHSMNKVFSGISYSKSILDMILADYLCEPMAIQVFSKTDLSDVKVIAGEFNQKQLENKINIEERNRLIVEAYKKYASDRKHTICFTSGISHSEELAKEFNKYGIYAKSVDSTLNDHERESIINEFKNGKLPVLCNVGILTVGFDFPPVDCLFLCRPTKSKILYTQILGRGLRKSKGKENCLVIDICDIVKTHDLMDISSVFDFEIKSGETPTQAIERIKKEQEEYEKRQQEEELKRQERERKQQEELELIFKQVKLFNRNMAERFKEAYMDWFKIYINLYAVSMNSDIHFAIEQENENEFVIYKISTKKENKYVEAINSGNNIIEMINYVENYAVTRPTSFAYRETTWKKENMTDKQRQYCRYGVTKWDAHKYFTSNSIKWQLKKYKEENII